MGNSAEISFVELADGQESEATREGIGDNSRPGCSRQSSAIIGVRGTGETHHLAFRCETRDQLNALRQQIKLFGVPCSPVIDHGMCASCYFEDPDGVQLEITFTQRGYLQEDYDLSLLGRTPAPEEDLFHPGHKAFAAQRRRGVKSRL